MFAPLYIALAGLGIATVAAYLDAWIKSKKPELSYAPTGKQYRAWTSTSVCVEQCQPCCSRLASASMPTTYAACCSDLQLLLTLYASRLLPLSSANLNATAFNTAVLSRCPTLHSVYQCTPFLTNGHVETIVVAKTRRPPGVDYRREILLTNDGGAVAIDWEHFDDEGHVRGLQLRLTKAHYHCSSSNSSTINRTLSTACVHCSLNAVKFAGSICSKAQHNSACKPSPAQQSDGGPVSCFDCCCSAPSVVGYPLQDLPADAPVLILFPGLTGGSCDSYVQHAVLHARHAGIRAAVFNSRGTADSPVLTPQFYSASFTDDTREVGLGFRGAPRDSSVGPADDLAGQAPSSLTHL